MMNHSLTTSTYANHIEDYRGWIVFTVMMLAILEVLDSTIINVALPSMMASLGANQNEITWVLTSYIVASAIILPITGFLTNVIGRQRFLWLCASGFMISSLLCGISTSLTEMVIFRVIQGMCGSSLIPISQTLLREVFPPHEHGKAMAIWGLGILAAPVFGPTLGGVITEHSTWRWVFFINLPFCLLGLLLITQVIKTVKPIRQSIDGIGLILMIIGVGALQIFLDKGNENGWFEARSIQSLALIAIFCLSFLMWRCKNRSNPLIRLQLYKDRNFWVCSVLMLIFCGTIFSFVTLQPILLENYFGYSAIQAGYTMGSLGLASAIGMALVSPLMKRFPIKYLLALALILASFGLWRQSHLNLQAENHYFVLSNIFIGFGMGLFMIPLSTQVFSSLKPQEIGAASGLFSYARMLGTSIGVSLITTLVSRITAISWHDLVAHINLFNPNLTYWLQNQNLTSVNPTAVLRLTHSVSQQSGLLGFMGAFKLLWVLLLLQIPLTLLLRNKTTKHVQ